LQQNKCSELVGTFAPVLNTDADVLQRICRTYGIWTKYIYFSTEYDYSQFDFEVRYRMLFFSPIQCSVLWLCLIPHWSILVVF